MPIETELKLRVDSFGPLRDRLASLGARFVRRVIETNHILDLPDGSLRVKRCGLRVRETVDERGAAGGATLTFKGPRSDGPLKRREEVEVEVDEARALLGILARLDFLPVLQYEKRRESWRCGSCRVELDEPPLLGLFVEIEGPDEDSIATVRNELGLAEAAAESQSYVAMLISYCERTGVGDRVLLLERS